MTEVMVDHKAARAYDTIRFCLDQIAREPGYRSPRELASYICDCIDAMDQEVARRGWQRPIP